MRQVLTNVVLLLAQTLRVRSVFNVLAPQYHVYAWWGIPILTARYSSPSTLPNAAACGTLQGKSLLVGGSTHEGEETMLLSVYRRLRQRYPNVLLVLAPRHLERVPVVMQHVQGHSCKRYVVTVRRAATRGGP